MADLHCSIQCPDLFASLAIHTWEALSLRVTILTCIYLNDAISSSSFDKTFRSQETIVDTHATKLVICNTWVLIRDNRC